MTCWFAVALLDDVGDVYADAKLDAQGRLTPKKSVRKSTPTRRFLTAPLHAIMVL